MKIDDIIPEYVDTIPKELKTGVLYISKEYELAAHLCACGCGGKTVTRIEKDEWSITDNEGVVTMRPSIGNWSGQRPYHAHYYITNNKIEWLK